MSLVQNFKAQTGLPNQINLTWDQPFGFDYTTDEIIVTRTNTHFPMELFNTDNAGMFESKATDSRGVEIFRGAGIIQSSTGGVSVLGNVLTDTSASFSISPPLTGRLIRDITSSVFRITSNTSTSVTVESLIIVTNGINSTINPSVGKYAILADFPQLHVLEKISQVVYLE